MAEIKKLNVGPALNVPLALASRGGQMACDGLEKLKVSEKFSAVKDHAMVAKITSKSDMLWTALGFVLIFHGAQFPNLFFCTQVLMAFCYGRLQTSVMTLYSDVKTAWDKTKEGADDSQPVADAKAEAKQENKHAQKRKDAATKGSDKDVQAQREEDVAATKKVLKVLDSDKVTNVAFELLVSFMACHMVIGDVGLARAAVVAHALVKASNEKISNLLDFSGHEDMQAWTDILLSFVLYCLFGGIAVIFAPLAFALNVAVCGAQLVTENGLRIAESMGKIPAGQTAEAFAASLQGLALLGGLTAFGALLQCWALMANSGMAWYSKMLYFPACVAECIIGFF